MQGGHGEVDRDPKQGESPKFEIDAPNLQAGESTDRLHRVERAEREAAKVVPLGHVETSRVSAHRSNPQSILRDGGGALLAGGTTRSRVLHRRLRRRRHRRSPRAGR